MKDIFEEWGWENISSPPTCELIIMGLTSIVQIALNFMFVYKIESVEQGHYFKEYRFGFYFFAAFWNIGFIL